MTHRLCTACEYDLRGTPASAERCPECGQILSDLALAQTRERRFLSSLGRRAVVMGGLALIATTATLVVFWEHALYIAPLVVLLLAMVPVVVAAYSHRRLP